MSKLGRYAVLFFTFMVVAHIARTISGTQPQNPASQARTAPQAAPETPKETEEQMAARLKAELQEKAEILGVRDMVARTYEAVRDRRSMEIRRATSAVRGQRLVVCMEFEAKNGFGGVDVGQAVWHVSTGKSDGKFSLDQATEWNRHCAGTKGNKSRTADAQETLAYLRSR